MKKGSARTSVWDCSHPFCRVMWPASVLSTFGRALATHHVLPLPPYDRSRSNCGRAAVLIDGLREQVENFAGVTSEVLFRVQ